MYTPIQPLFSLFRRLIVASGFISLLILLSGCSLDTRMSTFVTKGPVAETQYNLFMITIWVTFFIFLAVGGTYLYVVLKFRERPGDDRPLPTQSHGNPLVELGLIGVSILLLVIIAVPTVQGIWYTHDTPNTEAAKLGNWYNGTALSEGEEDDVLTIRVIGYQWWWEFEYPQLGVTTANEMVIPAGKPIHIELRSVDVIHSFWLPRIAGKVDLIPGRANSMWIQAGDDFDQWNAKLEKQNIDLAEMDLQQDYQDYLEDEIHNYYYGQCAEYCGDSHARMLFRAHVVGDDEFSDWIDSQKQGHNAPDGKSWEDWYAAYDADPDLLTGDINEGLKLFIGRGQCSGCHAIDGNPRTIAGVAGPSLTNVGERHSIAAGWLNHRNEDGSIDDDLQYANFVKWIKETDEVKPGNLMWWTRLGNGLGQMKEPLNDDEIHKLSVFLQTLK
tara:strand:+ start:360 stop:1685 length:1326 start_codon:yes stop_codon:yes gene_type:complete